MQHLHTAQLLDLTKTLTAPLFGGCTYPWEVLPRIKSFIVEYGVILNSDEYSTIGDNIWIAKSATVAPTASLTGPLIICDGAEIRHGAYIRGGVIVGRGAVVGNSCELKNCILFDEAKVPHFNYVGDSILGFGAHMGAGAITSNVKSDKSTISVKDNGNCINTGLQKFGAVLANMVEVGSGCVLNPGCVIGKNTNIYPLTSIRGVIPPDSIMKCQGNIVGKL